MSYDSEHELNSEDDGNWVDLPITFDEPSNNLLIKKKEPESSAI
jgi:hypothetical protein